MSFRRLLGLELSVGTFLAISQETPLESVLHDVVPLLHLFIVCHSLNLHLGSLVVFVSWVAVFIVIVLHH